MADEQPKLLPEFAAIVNAFRAASDDDGRVKSLEVGEAAKQVIPMYEKIFGNGVICSLLKKDLNGSSDGVITAAKAQPEAAKYIEGLIDFEIAHTKDLKTVLKNNVGIVRMLWMKRALDFITAILIKALIDCPDKEVKECAKLAYEETLKKYHGWLLSNIVTMALSSCPSRQQLFTRLGFTDQAHATYHLEVFRSVVIPILQKLNQALEDRGCNFPDKV
eukprot:GHVU01017988.1.p1 GENE.GHVU01017988.1~~GHVU01017988.1.p1  ORF type:complete len:244 (-),score=41.89 GHVU01017988.1:1795-2451(-)